MSALVLMMAGGTGGHVYPALAVANELRERGCRIEWVGTSRGLESRVVPANGIPLHCLSVRGVRGKSLLHKLSALAFLAVAAVQSLWLVLRLRPGCVVGMGGYAAGPAGVAAWLLRRPLLIHEQNAVAGTTNRMLAPLASKVVAGFAGAFAADIDVEVTGNPVRRDLLQAAASSAYDFDGRRPLRLLVLGGSLGARPINQVVPAALRQLVDSEVPVEIWHQTGEAHLAAVQADYGSAPGDGVQAAAFIDDMAAAYSWADVVLCRAGDLTVAELAIMGRPSILVPLPHAIDDHQTANARSLSDRGGAILLRQADMSVDQLAAQLRECIDNPQGLRAMALAARAVATPDAAKQVADRCEELCNAD